MDQSRRLGTGFDYGFGKRKKQNEVALLSICWLVLYSTDLSIYGHARCGRVEIC
jgi:hypothetical protein